jgi:cobalt-zinc-cadmium efflux system protein
MEDISATAQNRRGLQITFALTLAYFIVEVVGGILTNSLALLADAAHMLTDVFGLGLALFASWISQKPATPEKTYGYYRFEILAALANGVVLFFISFYILYEAYYRFKSPPEAASLPMMMIAVVGLVINLVGFWILRKGAKESLNVQGAFLEVISDALGSVGVIIAGVIMLATGWYYADPLFSVLIGLFILPRTLEAPDPGGERATGGNACAYQRGRSRTGNAKGERGYGGS